LQCFNPNVKDVGSTEGAASESIKMHQSNERDVYEINRG